MHTFCGVDSNSGRAPRCTPVKRMRGKLTLGNRQNDFCHPNGVCGTKSQGAASLPKIKDIYSVGLGCSLGAILNQTLPYPKSEPSCSTTKSIHPHPAAGCPAASCLNQERLCLSQSELSASRSTSSGPCHVALRLSDFGSESSIHFPS